MLQAVDPLRDDADEIALPAAEDLGDGLHAAGHLGLDAGQLGDLVVHLARPLGGGLGLERALAAGSTEEPRHEDEKRKSEPGEGEHRPRPR